MRLALMAVLEHREELDGREHPVELAVVVAPVHKVPQDDLDPQDQLEQEEVQAVLDLKEREVNF